MIIVRYHKTKNKLNHVLYILINESITQQHPFLYLDVGYNQQFQNLQI